jgi:DUF1365 family protein
MSGNQIFLGKVRHRRFLPKVHQFNYATFMHYLDLSSLGTVFNSIPFCSYEKFNWLSFFRKNYAGDPAQTLDQSIRQHILEKTGKIVTGKIYLLTQLSCLGYCFNPISIFFIDNTEQQIEMLVLEVSNTPWGEKHRYILDNPTLIKDNVYQFAFQKVLHVSPFMTMDFFYRFNIKKTHERMIIHMENLKDQVKYFDATLTLSSKPLDKTNTKLVLMKHPFMQFKVITGIYWQALKLWLKRIPFQTHPRKRS